MRIKFVLFLAVGLLLSAVAGVSGQETSPADKPRTAVGVARVVGAEKIVLDTDKGPVEAILTGSTVYFRLPPDNLKPSAATDSKLADITAGDRVLITGPVAGNGKDLIAVKVYLVKGSDIAKQQAERIQEWRTRGISGRITEVDPQAGVITVEMKALTGAVTTLKLTPKPNAKFLRYSPDSVKYSDAVKSDINEIGKDDMIQALGDRSEDGTGFQAEEILTGSFVTVAGKVKSVDPAKNEVTITDLRTEKDVTIAVNPNSMVKRFPEEAARRMVMFMGMMQSGEGGPPNARRGRGERSEGEEGEGRRGRNRPEGGDGEGRRGMGPGGGMGRMNINDMLNRFPTITVADLQEGEMIAVSSPKGKDETRLTAIKLLAGVEPFITLASMSGRAGGRGGVSGGLNIPGLDSLEF